MRSLLRRGVLSGTALALVLIPLGATATTVENSAAIESRIPVPEPADVPPPSLKDIEAKPATATPATAAPAPAADTRPGLAQLAPADAAVAEKLRDLIFNRLDRLMDRKKERAAVETFYAERGYAPLWIENGAASPRGQAAMARLKAADSDGLDAADYRVPEFGASPEQLAEAEIVLTQSVLTYARHVQAGRVHPSRFVSIKLIDVNPPTPEPLDILKSLAEAKDVRQALDGFSPPHPGYKALRAKLAEARANTSDAGPAPIEAGALLRIGMQDDRVPRLRERLGVSDDPASTTYDPKLAEAVKAFQRRSGLNPDGVIGRATVDALNGPRKDRDLAAIISNMERWRWLPRELGKLHVIVNIPDFTAQIVRDGKTVHQTRIVVGKPSTATPVFSDSIENIVVNPTWHVPESIIYGEYLPALQQDPTVLARMGLVMEHNRDGSISIRQPPGAANALGRLKFNFPNRHQVYMHDTPDKKLFEHNKRSYSHGCMRVQNPHEFAEVLLSYALPEQGLSAERLTRMYGNGEQTLKFRNPVSVHITYQTAFVDGSGKVVVREDLYGHDSKVQMALRNTDRRVADIAVPQRLETSSVSRREAARHFRPQGSFGLSFFERLFQP